MICSIVILGESMLNGWCRMRVRSFATDVICFFCTLLSREIIKLYLNRNKNELIKLCIFFSFYTKHKCMKKSSATFLLKER